ncbi:MAG TPA: ISNCY family transposase, partial [Acetobacteraceae bacterium]|nr:ISNCY family transposase [Acetobacteraceae bacterium]
MQRLDSLIRRLRQCFETFPDKRRGINTTCSIADIAMAAFSMLFMQCPSFLAYQRHLQEGRGRSNCEGLFGISKIPSDNHIRDMLNPADPALLYPMFPEVLRELEQSGGLSAFRRLGNHVP